MRELPRSRRVLSVGLWSVVKVSLAFYAVVGMSLVVAGIALSFVSSASGWTARLQHLGRTVFDVKSLPLGPAHAAAIAAAIAVAVAATGTIVNLLAALAYNCIAHFAGGVRVAVRHPDEMPGISAVASTPGTVE